MMRVMWERSLPSGVHLRVRLDPRAAPPYVTDMRSLKNFWLTLSFGAAALVHHGCATATAAVVDVSIQFSPSPNDDNDDDTTEGTSLEKVVVVQLSSAVDDIPEDVVSLVSHDGGFFLHPGQHRCRPIASRTCSRC